MYQKGVKDIFLREIGEKRERRGEREQFLVCSSYLLEDRQWWQMLEFALKFTSSHAAESEKTQKK